MVKYIDYKKWALELDAHHQTSHPLKPKLTDLKSSDDLTDGICYGKGAAFMKQLQKIMGEEKFKVGLQKFTSKYQYSNADIDDIIECFR